ncbi:MAG: putative quinol monooxygenase [Gammaproteobacteria bacterium]
MTCTVILEARVKPEFVDGMAEGFKGLFPDTRSFDGCIDLYATQSDDDPQQFLIVETWESREKYETYFAWRVETGVIADMNAMLEGELGLRFFNRIGA